MADKQLLNIDFNKIKESSSWNNTSRKELRMHQIHVYPAKFPSFLVPKVFNYIEKRKKHKIKTVGDIFCGCGTTALEAKLNNKNFWGVDINPVATLISRTKRNTYKREKIVQYQNAILAAYKIKQRTPARILNHERIKYWFSKEQIQDLYNLLLCIRKIVPKGKYRDCFLVAFSNILKKTSNWLTKSIKPTIDKNKTPHQVLAAYQFQIKQLLKAVDEASKKTTLTSKSKIENKNFLSLKSRSPFLDLLITSPPYVTSYEYADLHQLSTIWLDFVKDYRDLRSGTIGSIYSASILNGKLQALNSVGKEIYQSILKTTVRKKTSILKYFLDMKKTVENSNKLIKKNGYAVFVIGNTKFKGVYINNAKYLGECLLQAGFKNLEIKKRKVSSKTLTPYRDSNGKFSNDGRHRKVYNYEYILIAQK